MTENFLKSMTGFASGRAEALGYTWTWDVRSVNARGSDVRLRVPDWIDGLETTLRPMVQKTVARGNVNVTLKIQRHPKLDAQSVNAEALSKLLSAIQQIEGSAISAHNLQLAPTSAAQILAMPALTDTETGQNDIKELLKALHVDFQGILVSFDAMRDAEGQALCTILNGQLDLIEKLTRDAADAAAARRDAMGATLRENLARVLDNSNGADPERVAQELALIAVKSDVTEEIDRLHAHVGAARDLLTSKGPVGRKLDFLTQEFNREANTLCSKAQSVDLTRIGLDLKAVIDQMREQVQNVE